MPASHLTDVSSSEKLTTPRQFARIFLQDLDLPQEPYAEIIAASIEQQIEDAHIAEIEIGPAAGGPWASADPPNGQSFAQLPDAERRKNSRQWDWGLREMFRATAGNKRRRLDSSATTNGRAWRGAGAQGDPILSVAGERLDVGDMEDDLRVVIDVRASSVQVGHC